MEVPPVFTRACKKEKILCTCGVHVGYAHSTDNTTVLVVMYRCASHRCISVIQESENKFDVHIHVCVHMYVFFNC
jgi:hypothetical protein